MRHAMATTPFTQSDPEGRSTIHLRVPSDARFARTVRDAVLGFSSLHDVDDSDSEALLFAVGEALANAIEHANSDGDIEVAAEIDDCRIIATISDNGCGVDLALHGTIPLPHPLAERGRGIAIMQRCVDNVQIEMRPQGGTCVRLERLRREPQIKAC